MQSLHFSWRKGGRYGSARDAVAYFGDQSHAIPWDLR